MLLESLFLSPFLKGVASSLVASLIHDVGKAGLQKISKSSMTDLFEQALKNTIEDIKPEKAVKLLDVFNGKRTHDLIDKFEQFGETIPDSFFSEMFSPIIGKHHAKILTKEFFPNFARLAAKDEHLKHEIPIRRLMQIDALIKERFDQTDQKIDEIPQKVIEELLKKEQITNIEISIGYQEILAPPKDYVTPQHSLDKIKQKLKTNKTILLYGIAGSGKSVIASAYAREVQKSGRPVFWFRFKRALTDKNAFLKNLLPFLQNETGLNTTDLAPLISKSECLFVFDDLHYITDEKLLLLISTITEIVKECSGDFCSMLLTSREKMKVFDNSKMESLNIEGLSEQEATLLLNKHWQLAFNKEHLKRVLKIFENHPQFLQFFYQWYNEIHPDSVKLDEYLLHASKGKKIEEYLMKQLYFAFGSSKSNKNKMLTAVSFYRIPETEFFVQRLYKKLGGENFSETFYEMKNERGLIREMPESSRYDVHDLLRDFYYRNTENKKAVHELAAQQYQRREEKNPDLINPIFGAHHFRKADQHEAASKIIRPVAHHCITHGLYWHEINHTLERINFNKIKNDELKFSMLLNRGNLHVFKSDWDVAANDFSLCLKINSQNENFHHVFNSLGILSRAKGEWDKAIEFYEKSLKGKETLGDIHGLAQSYGNIGNVFQLKGEWDKAIEFYEKALKIDEKVGDIHGMAQTYGNLGAVYQLKGEWDKAIEFYEKALKDLKKVGDIHGMAQTYGNLSLLFFEQEKYQEAVSLMYEILFLFARLGAAAEVAQVGGILTDFQKKLGDKEFKKIADKILHKILKEGVSWGKLQVVSVEQAKEIWERLNSGEK